MSSQQALLLHPVQSLPTPKGPPKKWDRQAAIEHAQTGMAIELSTIPLYLYAMFSIKPDNKEGIQARAGFRGIIQQEMLHLSLTGNLLSALDGSMNLYNSDVIPKYPGLILKDNIPMNLDGATKENLEYFQKIEAPYNPPKSLAFQQQSTLPDYDSIGQFYEEFMEGLKQLPDSDLSHNYDKQLSSMDFFGSQMIVITNRSTARGALTTVVEQGEGGPDVDNSHYSVFKKLSLMSGSFDLYQVPKNPKTKDCKGNDYVYKLSLAFDAGYCYLLQTIQRVWQTGSEEENILLRLLLLRNIQVIMTNVLTPLADILVHQEFGFRRFPAAPCFNYFPSDDHGNPMKALDPTALHETLVEQVNAAHDAAPSQPAGALDYADSLERMSTYIKEKIPPQPN